MNLKYSLYIILINVSIVFAVLSSDCDSINAFYQDNLLKRDNNENCCLWSNIECVNDKIKSLKCIDDSNIKIDFTKFPILEELTSLTFQGKYLMGGSVPSIFFQQPKLVELIMDNSNIWELPNLNPSNSGLIETISLKNNLLTSFPYNLKNISKLKNLIISNNKMSNKLNDEIKQFPSLEKLDISSNFLNGDLPDMPSNLKELYIDDNQFSSLSLSSSQSPNLEIFSANNNNLGDSSFSHLTDFKSLKKISLDNTDLKEIPSSIDSLENLSYLSLRRNSISELPENIEKLSLVELNISDNSNLNGKLKSNVNIKNCYINHTKVCLENSRVCDNVDSSNICGESGSSGISIFIIICLIIIIIGLICYIVNFVIKLRKENNNGFARMSKNLREVDNSMYSNDSTSGHTNLRSRTSKEVINSINEAVNLMNHESDTKIKNAEIAFSNGLKIVDTANDAFNLNKNQKNELKEIFRDVDVDSIDGEITHINNNSFDNENTIPSLNRSIVSNPGVSSEHVVPIFNSLPRLNNYNGPNINILPLNNNYILNNNTPNINLNTLNVKSNINNNNSNPILTNININNNLHTQNISSNSNTNNYSNSSSNINNSNHNHNNNNNNNNNNINNSVVNNIEIKKRPRSRSSLANSSEIILNNNMNILRMNVRDTTMPGIRQDYAKDYANEYNNKINTINSDKPSQIYTNNVWNTVNGFNLENFNNYNTIQNSPTQSISNRINNNNNNNNNNNKTNNEQSCAPIITSVKPISNNNTNINVNPKSPVLVTYPVYGSLKRNQIITSNNKIINNNNGNDGLRKDPVPTIPTNTNNNFYVLKSGEANIPTLIVNPSVSVNHKSPISPTPSLSLNRNLSINSNKSTINTDTNTNINSLIAQSNSISLSSNSFNTSLSEDELSKNVMFQNPSIQKSNSNKTGNSNKLLPIFNHKDSVKSATNNSNISSSFELHLDSIEMDNFINDINSK
eukprot:jgi/Orpsp1_1/1177939/evm.model.c7180000063421.1